MSDFLRRQVAALWNFIITLAAVVYALALMAVIYLGLMVGVALVTFIFFFVLSFLPEPISRAILATIDLLSWLARLGVRDGG